LQELSPDEPYRHIITIGQYMGDGGYVHFVMPAQAFREGDYSQTVAYLECF
jgi:hypothetical protein